jgi:hypothetical protein
MDKEKQREAAGVDSVTDYVEEKEAGGSKAQESLSQLSSTFETQNVLILTKEYVDSLVEECDLSRQQAEKLLTKHQNNLNDAITDYIRGVKS